MLAILALVFKHLLYPWASKLAQLGASMTLPVSQVLCCTDRVCRIDAKRL